MRIPAPRPASRPPRGVFTFNGSGGCDFIESRLWLWQWQPSLGLWIVIDGPQGCWA